MLSIPELNFGFNDAENYRRKENKELFNHIFLRTDALERLCEMNNYFLIGEKGTGKTAYAVFLSNNFYKNNFATIRSIRETEYLKFLTLKKERHLALSDYTNIWKVIIYILLAEQVSRFEKGNLISRFSKFQNLKKAMDEYYTNAFSPEIIYAIRFAEESKIAAELIAHYAKVGGEETTNVSFTEERFQTNLLYIQKKFEDALGSLKISNNHILFIDGVDIRPSSIPYDEYIECVKGLANAIWSVNNDFFSSIRDSKGRIRTVLLIRPDIFNSLGLQNQNNKIRDNSVLLDWRTTYPEYRQSGLFKMADNLLRVQQKEILSEGQAWDYYFQYDAPNVKDRTITSPTSFIEFLRFSLYRPRDIITMLRMLRENYIEQNSTNDVFIEKDFDHPTFRRNLSDYLLGEIKDHLAFYYSSSDYELFLKFFEYLNGSYGFTYDEYLTAYSTFIKFITDNKKERPVFFETPDIFLQFLYDLNILCYVEETIDEPFIRWCFRERSLSNISPKVKTHMRYEIHYGFSKSLNLGKYIFKQ